MNVSDLTRSLAEYSPTVNSTTNSILQATKPMAYVLISIVFLIEMDSWYRYLKQEGGGITTELWLEAAFKYIVAYLLVSQSGLIFDAILELVNIMIKMVNSVVPESTNHYSVELGKIKGAIIKNILAGIGGATEFIAGLSAKLLVMMRAFQMYLLKAVSAILIAFFMADSTRPIALNVLKYFGAAAFQGVILLIVIRVYPTLVPEDLLKINMSETFESWVTAFVSIAKGIIFIFMMFSSQRVAKNLIGVH